MCENHRGISLTPVITKLLASIILHRLTPARDNRIREQKAGFRPGRGCIDHIFTLRQYLEHMNIFCRPIMAVFLDLKAAFDSVNRKSLFNLMLRQGVPLKYVSIMKALYSHTTGRVRAYGQLSNCFRTSSGVRQGCFLSPFLLNFVMDDISGQALKSTAAHFPNAQDETLFDLEYADDNVCTFVTFRDAQSLSNSLICSAVRYGLTFAPVKRKIMLFNWTEPVCPLFMEGEKLEQAERFTYLGSCISTNGNITSEITVRISKAQAAFSNLRHLWRCTDVSLATKGRVYNATVRLTLPYGSETWPLRSGDLHKLQVFDHRFLRAIGHFSWKQRIINDEVRHRIFGDPKSLRRLNQIILGTRLLWLGHVLRMNSYRLPQNFYWLNRS